MYICVKKVEDHTMEAALLPYIAMKIHPEISSFTGSKIIIRGKYERKNSIISPHEKHDKLFNWKRPTVEYSDDCTTLYVNCFPGIDYVRHYASLIKTFFNLYCLKCPKIRIDLPIQAESLEQLKSLKLDIMPESDIIIFGNVEKLQALTDMPWQGGDDFYWSSKKIYGKQVTLLGCAFSLWGDIAGNLIHVLKNKKIKTVFYVGKLGGIAGMNKLFVNETIATGSVSMLDGRLIKWMNLIKIPTFMQNVQEGNHITVFSPLAESKEWLTSQKASYSYVDPEIGHIAYAAHKCSLKFSYIHIVSDILGQPGNENLSNERDWHIVQKREQVNLKILAIFRETLKNIQ
ncbi:hypothetical protein KBC04_03980 [Candidatus Babeliales bacterium]|nr:hypothetical protein [Candidatus Babeliales bacterium]MBP9843345.1 hypothetical protein [Candidatus Babeliales bacterium]